MRKNIVVVGASLGGLDALRLVVAGLPSTIQASILVVLHTSADSPGMLAGILQRAGPLRAVMVKTSEQLRDGMIYVAAPDHHLVIEPGIARATKGPRENRSRPAVDPLFRSAAQTYGPCVIGVILTGALDDGTAGLWAVKHLGGTAVVQDPIDAFAPSMPRSAMQHVPVDHCVLLQEIAPLLVRLTDAPADDDEGVSPMPESIAIEVDIAKEQHALKRGVLDLGEPSNFACPECHGVLLRIMEDTRIRFRCHTGHAYSTESLMAEMNEAVEATLWSAVRAVEESALLMRHLAGHAGTGQDEASAGRLEAAAQNAHRRAEFVRQALLDSSTPDAAAE